MRNEKYELQDLIRVANGEESIENIAETYNVSLNSVRCAMARRGIFKTKKKIKIVSPYKVIIVNSIQECCDTLKLSRTTIKKALHGQRVPILDNLEIKIMEVSRYAEEKTTR